LTRVYVAKTKRDFERAQEFLDAQPVDSLPYKCYHTSGVGGRTIEELQEQWETLRVYIVEDDDRNIRIVCIEFLSDYDLRGKIVKATYNLCLVVHHEDYENKNWIFLSALLPFTMSKCHEEGVKLRFVTLPEAHIDFARQVYGDALEIIGEYEEPTELFKYRLQIDVEKFFGET